jgi:hypothetical protein
MRVIVICQAEDGQTHIEVKMEDKVCAKFVHTAEEGKIYQTQFYNLDAIISVGYILYAKKRRPVPAVPPFSLNTVCLYLLTPPSEAISASVST